MIISAGKGFQGEEGWCVPANHDRRDQILNIAAEHFRTFVYKKSSISDIGRAIGISQTYDYRLFDSKQEIG